MTRIVRILDKNNLGGRYDLVVCKKECDNCQLRFICYTCKLGEIINAKISEIPALWDWIYVGREWYKVHQRRIYGQALKSTLREYHEAEIFGRVKCLSNITS